MSNKEEIKKSVEQILADTEEVREIFAGLHKRAKELKGKATEELHELYKDIAQILERDLIQKLTKQRKKQPGKDHHSERLPRKLRTETYVAYEELEKEFKKARQGPFSSTELICEQIPDKLIETLGEMFGCLVRVVIDIELDAKSNMKIDLS